MPLSLLEMMDLAVESVEGEDAGTDVLDASAPIVETASEADFGIARSNRDPEVARTPVKSRPKVMTSDDVVTKALARAAPAKERTVGHTGQAPLSGIRKTYEECIPPLPGLPDSIFVASDASPVAELRRPAESFTQAPNETVGTIFEGHIEVDDDDNNNDLEDEWAEVAARTNEIRVKEMACVGKVRAADPATAPMSFVEARKWASELTVDPEVLRPLRDDLVDGTSCGCMPQRRPRSDVPRLSREHGKEKDLVLFLKQTDFDFNVVAHFRMLRTVYMKLSRNKVCPSIGGHWEVLGFQHTDPRSDLNRSGGVLNVLHMLFFFSQHFEIFKSIYLLAQDERQNFPLACVSIGITRMVIECLLAGRLSRLCNKRPSGSLLETTCSVHAASLYHFYARWRSQKRTIADTEKTNNEVRALIEKRPEKLIQELANKVEEHRSQRDPARLEFTDLDLGSARPAEIGRSVQKAKAEKVPTRLNQYVGADDAS